MGSYAFNECTNLTSVTIGNNITTIGQDVFANCTSLTSINIPSSVTRIWYSAFYGCTGLTSVTIGNNITTIGQDAFARYTSLTSITFATGSNIPNANFGVNVFPEGSSGVGGNTLKTAYSTGKAGTYTREANGSTWTKTSP
jgi:hypothetical protein